VSSINIPTQEQLEYLVAPYTGIFGGYYPLGFAIGYVGPGVHSGNIFYAGRLLNQYEIPLPLNEYTQFPIASVTKTFTAALYADLVQKSFVPAHATLGDYYRHGPVQLPPVLDGIPLSTLGNYTSGLPADDIPPITDQPDPLPVPYSSLDMFEYLRYLAHVQTDAPGQTYSYSNLAFSLLAEALAAAALAGPASYARILHDYILQPLQMHMTRMLLDVPGQELPLGLSSQTGDAVVVPSTGPQFPAYNGAGGLVSTPADMMRWLKFNMGLIDSPLQRLLPALQMPSTPVIAKQVFNSSLGIAWYLSHVDGLSTAWKDGVVMGFNSYVTFVRSAEPGRIPSPAGVFVLTNSDGPAIYEIANDLLFIMMQGYPGFNKLSYPRRAKPGRLRAELLS
jgi:D-alanyl-D-alanine-carboxypeptidase/D-alanyl-D-alanine-endopeptidase